MPPINAASTWEDVRSRHAGHGDAALNSTGGFSIDIDVTSSSSYDRAEARFSTRYKPLLLPWEGFDIARRSVALRGKPMEICILALHPSASRAFNVTGSSQVDLTDCTVTANSDSAAAISIGGSASLKARCLVSHGGISLQNPVSLDCEEPQTNAPTVADPFADKQIPQNGPVRSLSDFTLDDTGLTLLAGVYQGLRLEGSVTLKPGYYIINGGKLQVSGDAVIIGNRVTFFLTDDAELDIHAQATIQLTPPTEGSWEASSSWRSPGIPGRLS